MITVFSKLDSARRQLETAIGLFFKNSDPVSTYTLTRASHEILGQLCNNNGAQSVLDWGLQIIKEEKRDEVRKHLDNPKNFFKHAGRDPNATVEFNPDVTNFFIWDACRLYQLLTTEAPKEMYIFKFWFSMTYPEYLEKPEHQELIRSISESFDTKNRSVFYYQALSAYDLLKSQGRI
ncbi:MAG: hypothetical protein G01um101420_86 [Parcubacteria group bacterium Gr01-1014_20]|nr:MAG: hypothetical protein G01um101420_86 [Parcubacteria group bacterium Gr01-1014_20]